MQDAVWFPGRDPTVGAADDPRAGPVHPRDMTPRRFGRQAKTLGEGQYRRWRSDVGDSGQDSRAHRDLALGEMLQQAVVDMHAGGRHAVAMLDPVDPGPNGLLNGGQPVRVGGDR